MFNQIMQTHGDVKMICFCDIQTGRAVPTIRSYYGINLVKKSVISGNSTGKRAARGSGVNVWCGKMSVVEVYLRSIK